MDVKQLLESDFVSHYGISCEVSVDAVNTDSESFDLDDSCPVNLLPESQGKVSFLNPSFGSMEVVSYEGFVNQCKKPRNFLVGRKRCDYILCHSDDNGYVVLLEVTSAFVDCDGNDTLSMPIGGYPGGKSEKCEVQLKSSLEDLMSVPGIGKAFLAKSHRICLMAYELKKHTDKDWLRKHPFMRYLGIESMETGEDGAVVPNPGINVWGFEYRRISHNHSFRMA